MVGVLADDMLPVIVLEDPRVGDAPAVPSWLPRWEAVAAAYLAEVGQRTGSTRTPEEYGRYLGRFLAGVDDPAKITPAEEQTFAYGVGVMVISYVSEQASGSQRPTLWRGRRGSRPAPSRRGRCRRRASCRRSAAGRRRRGSGCDRTSALDLVVNSVVTTGDADHKAHALLPSQDVVSLDLPDVFS